MYYFYNDWLNELSNGNFGTGSELLNTFIQQSVKKRIHCTQKLKYIWKKRIITKLSIAEISCRNKVIVGYKAKSKQFKMNWTTAEKDNSSNENTN